jgi:hypothetical protein
MPEYTGVDVVGTAGYSIDLTPDRFGVLEGRGMVGYSIPFTPANEGVDGCRRGELLDKLVSEEGANASSAF